MSRRENFLVEAANRGAAAQGAAPAGGGLLRRSAHAYRCCRPQARRSGVLRNAAATGGAGQAPGWQAPEQKLQRRGPPVTAAFDATVRPRARRRLCGKRGVELSQLAREKDAKGNEFLSYSGVKPGAATVELLPGFVREALDPLPIPKRMRWGASEAQFVRPVHGLILLFGRRVIPARSWTPIAGNMTRGHRYMSSRPLRIGSPASYATTLERRGKVIASFAARREKIRAGVTQHRPGYGRPGTDRAGAAG